MVGAVNLAVAVDTVVARGQSGMSSPVSGRYDMTLTAGSVASLFQQPIVGRTVGVMTFTATGTLNQVRINHRVFMNIRSGYFVMTIPADPVQPGRHPGIFDLSRIMAIATTDIARLEWMAGRTIEFQRHSIVAGRTVIVAVVFHQVADIVVMNFMTARTTKILPEMRVSGDHGGLVGSLMASRAEVGLLNSGELMTGDDRFQARFLQMSLPAGMTTDTSDRERCLAFWIGNHAVNRFFERFAHLSMAFETELAFFNQFRIGEVRARSYRGERQQNSQ